MASQNSAKAVHGTAKNQIAKTARRRGKMDACENLVGGAYVILQAVAAKELGDWQRASPAHGDEIDGRVIGDQRARRVRRERGDAALALRHDVANVAFLPEAAAERTHATNLRTRDEARGVREGRIAGDDARIGAYAVERHTGAEHQAVFGCLLDQCEFFDATQTDESLVRVQSVLQVGE